jgi:acyl-CoA reductase-like NAD-dependent aldehyde dehydrogenase
MQSIKAASILFKLNSINTVINQSHLSLNGQKRDKLVLPKLKTTHNPGVYSMTEKTIADAARHIEDMAHALDNAYWEASTTDRKDAIYSIISIMHAEQSELAKLSIQDHHMPYEAITAGFRDIKTRLNVLRKSMDEMVIRPKTAEDLDSLISEILALS